MTQGPEPVSEYHLAPEMKQVRCEIVFLGKVQGVGFRATTRAIAQPLRITGWVRNEPDGSVRLVAEGPDEDIRALLSTLDDTMGQLIHTRTDSFSTPTGEFEAFEIRR